MLLVRLILRPLFVTDCSSHSRTRAITISRGIGPGDLKNGMKKLPPSVDVLLIHRLLLIAFPIARLFDARFTSPFIVPLICSTIVRDTFSFFSRAAFRASFPELANKFETDSFVVWRYRKMASWLSFLSFPRYLYCIFKSWTQFCRINLVSLPDRMIY